jgi:hypothetical protein
MLIALQIINITKFNSFSMVEIKHKHHTNYAQKTEHDCQNCKTRSFMGTELMLCLMDISHCKWGIIYKQDLFICKHQSALEFSKTSK